MSHSHLENTIFELFCRYLPHRQRQLRRLASVCSAVQLAGNTQLSLVARRLPKPTQQPSRIVFLRRFLMSPLFSQEMAYRPLVAQALRSYHAPIWHLTIDRSNLIAHKTDLLMVSLSYHKRAIPLAWQLGDFGPTNAQEQMSLLKQVFPLVPEGKLVIVHGDAEFGSVPFMQFITEQAKWDFILGQSIRNQFQTGDWVWQSLANIRVTPSQPYYEANLFWTKTHRYGPINLFAFFHPYQSGPGEPRREVRYCTTSLPINRTLRRLGRRRWGCEPMFRDYKSSGWHIDLSGLQHDDRIDALLVVLSFNYLWASSLGRWLCKVRRRHEIDGKKSGITACFVSVGTG
jgi:hypothetical protein